MQPLEPPLKQAAEEHLLDQGSQHDGRDERQDYDRDCGVGARHVLDGVLDWFPDLERQREDAVDTGSEQQPGEHSGSHIPTQVVVRGIDKQLVGETAARIRRTRPPEPYKGKGIRYEGEQIRRKVGKRA